MPALGFAPGEDALVAALRLIARFYVDGIDPDWRAVHGGAERERVELPHYPFERRRHWLAGAELDERGGQSLQDVFVGQRLSSPLFTGVAYEALVSAERLPIVSEHLVYGEVVVPGAMHVSRLLTLLRRELGEQAPLELAQIEFEQAVALARGAQRQVQVVLQDAGEWQAFSVVSKPPSAEQWTRHAGGRAKRGSTSKAADALAVVRQRIGKLRAGAPFLAWLQARQLTYGPQFCWIDEIAESPTEVLARLRAPTSDEIAAGYALPPGMIDSFFQAATALMLKTPDHGDDPFVPIRVERFELAPGWAGGETWCHCRQRDFTADGATADITIYDAAGQVVAMIEAARIRRAPARSILAALSQDGGEQGRWLYRQAWREQVLPPIGSALPTPACQIVALDAADNDVALKLADALQRRGGRSEVVPLMSWTGPGAATDVVCVGPRAAAGDRASLERMLHDGALGLLHLTQRLCADDKPRRLILLTERALGSEAMPATKPWGAGGWGLLRTAAAEHPELTPVAIDCDNLADQVNRIADEIVATSDEREISLYGEKRSVARLERIGDDTVAVPVSAQNYRLRSRRKGVLDGLELEPCDRRREIGPDEVEVRVAAIGLNFRDVLNAMGMYPGEAGELGLEAAGEITRVGARVTHVREGDRVFGMFFGSAAHYAYTDGRLVTKVPARCSLTEAATLAATFLTVAIGLEEKGRLARGERVLIHAAAGGVGLAAIQVAQRAGAEIYATASRGKHAYLRSLGVQHVYDSRSVEFYDEIMHDTGGHGVDVVLNSLVGEALVHSLRLLRKGGRFVEIGKLELFEPSEIATKYGVEYATVALDDRMKRDPQWFVTALARLSADVEAGALKPVRLTEIPLAECRRAFRFMAAGKHIGKVVLGSRGAASPVEAMVAAGAVIISGGLGALGRAFGEWVAGKGAKDIVLFGRTQPSAEALASIARMRERGAKVEVAAVDVADAAAVAAVIDAARARAGGIGLVLHAAGVLADATLREQSWSKLEAVLRPKVLGAHVLEACCPDAKCVVYFSSISALIGNGGQANYAVANAILDAMARSDGQRRVISIGWGPWAEGGMAAQGGQARSIASHLGVRAIDIRAGAQVLERVLASEANAVEVLPVDWKALKSGPLFALATQKKFAELMQREGVVKTGSDDDFLATVQQLPPPERLAWITARIVKEVRAVVGGGVEPAPGQPLLEFGVDSLMAVELRNRLASIARKPLPSTLVFDYPTVAELARMMLGELNLSDPPPAAAAPPAPADVSPVELVAKLSADAAREALLAELAELREDDAK